MLRTFIASLAFVAGTGAALAASPADCRSIQDSLLRLRCYDGAAVPAGAAPAVAPTAPSAGKATAFGFENYPARVYAGPTRLPTFTGPTRRYAMFRTRITEGMREGVNFAGHLAVVQFGCGTGCSVVLVGDLATGSVADFPVGGEDAQSLELNFRRDSNLIVAQWQENDRCVRATYVWAGGGFSNLSRADLGTAEGCWKLR